MYVKRPLYYHWITFPVNKKASQTLLMSEAFRSLGLRKHETMETNIEEIWKGVVGFDKYQVSELGNVRSKKKLLPIKPTVWGWYKRVKLYRCGVRYYFNIHRLVAKHFVENPKNYPLVLHNDNDPFNNHASNLRWGTYLNNNLQAIREGRHVTLSRPQPKGEKSATAKLTNADVLAIRKELQVGLPLSIIAKQYGTTKGNIWKIKAGYSWSSVQ